MMKTLVSLPALAAVLLLAISGHAGETRFGSQRCLLNDVWFETPSEKQSAALTQAGAMCIAQNSCLKADDANCYGGIERLEDNVKPFGLDLGEPPATMAGCGQRDDTTWVCTVQPPTSSAMFDEYRLFLTPTSKLASKVVAWRVYEGSSGDERASEDYLVLKVALEQKYGVGRGDVGFTTVSQTYRVQGVEIVLERESYLLADTRVRITYTLESLLSVASKEASEIRQNEAKKKNAGQGL